MQTASNAYYLRRVFRRGWPAGAAEAHISVMGTVNVQEEHDARSRRTVKTATFERLDGGEPIPPLRNVDLLIWTTDVIVMNGVEELASDHTEKPQRVEQTWRLRPAGLEELTRVEARYGRCVKRLLEVGVKVHIFPDGILIDGETDADGNPVEGRRPF